MKKVAKVVVQINEDARVLDGPDGIQWTFETRAHGARSWYQRGYCRTRMGLETCIRAYCFPETAEETIAAIAHLPDRYPEASA